MRFYALNMPGGNADLACAECLPEAEQELLPNGLMSVAIVDLSPGERCSWCFREKEDKW